MRKVLYLSLLTPLFIVTPAFAESSVSSVVENHVNASNSNSGSSSNVTSHTSITTETNGKVTHYESDQPNQKVEVKAVNGESTIKVDGEAVTGSPTKEDISKEPSAAVSVHPTLSNQQKEEVKENLNQIQIVLETIKAKINSLEEKLSSLFH